MPENLTVVDDVSQDTIVDRIGEATSRTSFVIVDLEHTVSLVISYASGWPIRDHPASALRPVRHSDHPHQARDHVAGRAVRAELRQGAGPGAADTTARARGLPGAILVWRYPGGLGRTGHLELAIANARLLAARCLNLATLDHKRV